MYTIHLDTDTEVLSIYDPTGHEVMAFRLSRNALRIFTFQAMRVLMKEVPEENHPQPSENPIKLNVVK